MATAALHKEPGQHILQMAWGQHIQVCGDNTNPPLCSSATTAESFWDLLVRAHVNAGVDCLKAGLCAC